MRGGNLSNDVARGIGVRFEGVLKTQSGGFSTEGKRYLESVGSLEINRFIITTGSERKAMAFCYKWSIPYFRVIEASSDLEIANICNEHAFLFYYDVDRRVIENVNSRSRGVKAIQWTSQED